MATFLNILKKIIALAILVTLIRLLINYRHELPAPSLTNVFQGYIEGEFLHLAAPVAGTLNLLTVQKGSPVKMGELLFSLEPEPEATAVREAKARLLAAQARLKDLKTGQRPTELNAIKARLAKAQTDLALAHLEQARYEKLFRQKMVQEEAMDSARATTARNEALLQEVTAQLETAKLAAREDLIAAATAEVAVAQATVDKAQWWLKQKQVSAPQAGPVVDIFYYHGEWVPMGSPVLSLLPPTQVKVRFFVPETVLGRLTIGQSVKLSCDSCPSQLTAKVNYIAVQAEYTPPVIYSQENRSKLVYMIEAKPAKEVAAKLSPGQLVEVRI